MQSADNGAGARLDVRFFGQANVGWNGAPLKFAKRSTTLAMLARVILQRGQAVSRESLAFALFPDVDEAAALAELRRYLYLTAKALPERAGEPWLLVEPDTVRWNVAAEAFVDIVEFEKLGANPETQALAIDLYGGDLLEDVYDDWVVSERERLRSRYLAIAGETLERHRAKRNFGEAIGCAKRILAVDPFREDAMRSLVALRYESGDAAGALVDYDRFAKRLRDDLDVSPMPETIAVRDSILRHEAVPGSIDLPIESDALLPPARTRLPFVGRQRELGALKTSWTRAARGFGSIVFLTGEAGVGKSRLAAEFARGVQSEGGRAFIGTTSAPESSPYQAIVEALRSALPLLQARPPIAARRAVLAHLLPELREASATAIDLPDSDSQRETARLYDALANALHGLASARPLLLVLEDLHWAGSASIDALGAIVKELSRAPVLVIATARDEETLPRHPLRSMLRSLGAVAGVEHLHVERLDERDVGDLVELIDALPDRDGDLSRALYSYSEGNALFLNEVIWHALEHDGSIDVSAATSISSLLEHRIAQLGEDARAVAGVAAVAGPGCDIALVREVTNLPAASVARGFNELLDRRLIREAGARSGYDFVFTHHLIAAATYDGIEPEFRAQRHSRIARILEAEYDRATGGSARDIARHYERSGDAGRAGEWYVTAGRQATAVHAYGDAEELATHALRLVQTDGVRAAALDVREKARERRADRAGQLADIDALDAIANGEPAASFDVLMRRVRLARSLGETNEEGCLIDDLADLAASLDAGAQAHALAQRATHLGLRSRQSEGLAPARAALELYERLGDQRGQLECLSLLAEFSANVGDVAASKLHLATIAERAATLSDRAVEARALDVTATAALLRQEYRDCFEMTERALALHGATGHREGVAAAQGRLAVAAAWLGDYATALREFARALESYESIGNKRGLAVTHTNRTLLLMRLGAFEEALESIERSNALFEVANEQRTVVANRVNASFVRLHLGEPEVAKALALEALALAKDIGFPIFEAAALANLGNAERALGEIASAAEHMESGIAMRRPIQEARDFVDDLADLTMLYAQAGRGSDALASARELSSIGSSSFEGAFWPHYVWWAAAIGFAAGGEHEGAAKAAARAGEELRRFAESIEDARTREAFFRRSVNAAIQRGVIPLRDGASAPGARR